jgi:hypothetical protein
MKTKSDNTQDSASEKLVPGSILMMDINAIPREHGIDMEKWAFLIKDQGILLYDGNAGSPPILQPENDTIKVYDVSEEATMKELEEELNNLEGPLKPIIAPAQPKRAKKRRGRTVQNNMSGLSQDTISADGTNMTITYTDGGTAGNIVLDSSFSPGDQLTDGSGTTFSVADGSQITINPISVPAMSDQEVQEFQTNWEAAQVAIAQGEHTPTPIVYGTGGEGTLTMEENTVASVFESEPISPDEAFPSGNSGSMTRMADMMEEEGTDSYENLTEEAIQDALDIIMEDTPASGVANRNELAVVGSPLTDNEINQLGIEDPRGQDLLDSGPVTPSETAMIDAVMNAQPARPVRRRAPRQIEPGFNLTDDTE